MPAIPTIPAIPANGPVWPPHPGYPDGTRALPMAQTGPHSLWQAAEYVMRPLAIVARAAGEHGAVVDLDPARFRIEVDRGGRPTGRIVVELLPDAEGDVSLPDWLLTRCVDRLAERCITGGQEVRAWLRAVAGHELDSAAARPELGTVSNTRSISQLRPSELASRPTAASHGVWLTTAQTKRLTEQLVQAAVRSGERTAERVREWGRTLPESDGHEHLARLIHRALSRKQFRRGSLKGYPLARAMTDMLPAIRNSEPIHVVLLAFPVKQADSGLKAFGAMPDFAEFAFLVRLKELHTAISGVYEPGMRVTLLSDAQHYRSRPGAQPRAYAEKIAEYIQMAEASNFLQLRDIDEVANKQLGTQAMHERPARLAAHIRALTDAFGRLDIAADPVGTLRRSVLFDPAGFAAPASPSALADPAARANLAALADLAASTGSDTLVVLADLAAFASSDAPAAAVDPADCAGTVVRGAFGDLAAVGGSEVAADLAGSASPGVPADPVASAAGPGVRAAATISAAAGTSADLAASGSFEVSADLAASTSPAVPAAPTASAVADPSAVLAESRSGVAAQSASVSPGAPLDSTASAPAGTPADLAASRSGVAALFSSLVHSVPVPLPDGADRRDWSSRVYADLYRTGEVSPALAAARSAVLRAAWDAAIRYVAVLRTDREMGYDQMLGTHVRLTAVTPGADRCGFAGLGGSALLPWHGTGAVDRQGVVSTDFAISLLDRAFVPVYSDALGGGQPWFMAPIAAAELAGAGSARLSDVFLDAVRLRRH